MCVCVCVCVCVGGRGWGVGGVQLVPGEGVQFLISFQIYRTNDFQGGGGPGLFPPPLDPRMYTLVLDQHFMRKMTII